MRYKRNEFYIGRSAKWWNDGNGNENVTWK